MTYKTIVAVLDVPRYARQVSDFAIFLADACDAHLIGLHAEAVTMTPVVMPMSATTAPERTATIRMRPRGDPARQRRICMPLRATFTVPAPRIEKSALTPLRSPLT